MLVAITGGTGFIGQNLVARHIEAGDTVRILTRRHPQNSKFSPLVQFHYGDLTEGKESLIPFVNGVDILYHCAGEVNNPSRMRKVHVEGTGNLLEAAKGKIGRWVQVSSVGAYGPNKSGTITEETPLNPKGAYEVTKTESDELVIHAGQMGHIHFTILRPSNVYGVGMTKNYIHRLISVIAKKLFFFIGPPGAVANYIHVQNVAEALMLCGKDPKAVGKTYLLSDHRSLEIFVQTISDALAIPHPKRRSPERPIRWLAFLGGLLPGFPLTTSRVDALITRSVYSTQRIETELGYAHLVSMESGLKEMVREFQKGRI